jgi:putative Holliday junction resolvase
VGRILSIDYGERRIGLAVSDATRTIASPLTTLTRRPGKRPPWPELQRLIAEHDVSEIVIGLPLEPSGAEGEWAREVRGFGRDVARRTGLPVHWVDERLSSVVAERAVRGMGLKRSQREEKARVDATAAAILLRLYLAGSRIEEDGNAQ